MIKDVFTQESIKKQKLQRKLSRAGFMFLIMFIPLTLWVIFFFSVNIQAIAYAFQHITVEGEVSWVGFANITNFLSSLFSADNANLVVFSLFNSVKWWFLTLLISTPLNLAFAYYIFLNFRGSKAFRIIAMLPSMVSGMVFSLLFEKTMNFSLMPFFREHFNTATTDLLRNESTAFAFNLFYTLWSGLTSSLIILPNAMKNYGQDVFEAAELDGCGIYSKFWYIVMPSMMPTQISMWIMGIAAIFSNSYNLVTFYKYDAPESLYTLGYYFTVRVMTGSSAVEYPAMSSAGLCLTIFATTITLIVKHYLMKLQNKFE